MTDQTPLTAQQLDEIDARQKAATAGPWGFYDGDNYADVAADLQMTSRSSYSYREKVAQLEDENYWDDPAHEDDDESRAPEQMAANAAFIAHARIDVPALLAEIRRLKGQRKYLIGQLAKRDAESGRGDEAVREFLTEEQLAAETLIGSITIPSESIQLDNGECLRDLAVGDSVELRADTGHEGLWIAAAFLGDFQEQITLQHAEVVEDCGSDPALACKFSGTRHAHPVDLDGKVRPRPTP